MVSSLHEGGFTGTVGSNKRIKRVKSEDRNRRIKKEKECRGKKKRKGKCMKKKKIRYNKKGSAIEE